MFMGRVIENTMESGTTYQVFQISTLKQAFRNSTSSITSEFKNKYINIESLLLVYF